MSPEHCPSKRLIKVQIVIRFNLLKKRIFTLFSYNLHWHFAAGIGIKSENKLLNDTTIKPDQKHLFQWIVQQKKLISLWYKLTRYAFYAVFFARSFLSILNWFDGITLTHIPICNYFTIDLDFSFIELFLFQLLFAILLMPLRTFQAIY